MKTAKQEIEEKIKELEEKQTDIERVISTTRGMIYELRQKANSLTEKPSRIRVPENIKFEGASNGQVAIVSPNGKCVLSAYHANGGLPIIDLAGRDGDITSHLFTDPLYLEPCNREDLKCGDVAYAVNNSVDLYDDTDEITKYRVILNNSDIAYWTEENWMMMGDFNFDFWYKVVR